MKIRIMTLDKPNKNNRIYPTEVFKAAIDKYTSAIVGRCAVGVIENYKDSEHWESVDLSKCSHLVEQLEIIDGAVMADIRVLDTVEGEKLAKMINEGVVTFRPRGMGQIDMVDEHYVVSDYEIVAIDAVLTTNAA